MIYIGQSTEALEWLCLRPQVDLLAAFTPPTHPARTQWVTRCAHYGVPLYFASSSLEVERHLPPAIDLGLCVHFERLGDRVLKAPRLGMINLHPAPLPDWPGRLPTVELILSGAREGGCALHWMSPRLDQGDLIAVKRVPLASSDGPAEAELKATLSGLKALGEEWDGVLHGYAPRLPQPPRTPHRSPRLRQSPEPDESPLQQWWRLKAYRPFGGLPFRWGTRYVCLTEGLLDLSSEVPSMDADLLSSAPALAEGHESEEETRWRVLSIDHDGAVTLDITSKVLLRCRGVLLEEETPTIDQLVNKGTWRPQVGDRLDPINIEERVLFPFDLASDAPLNT